MRHYGNAATTATTATNKNINLYNNSLSNFCQTENADSRTENKKMVVAVVAVVAQGKKSSKINGFRRNHIVTTRCSGGSAKEERRLPHAAME